MGSHAAHAARIEAEFIAGAQANLMQARGRELPGRFWRSVHRSQDERVRAAMRDAGLHDRELLASLPRNTTYMLTGSRRRWLFWKKDISVSIASVLSRIEHHVKSDAPASPLSLGDLLAHVRSLVGDAGVPHLVGVCSPSGFADEVRRAAVDIPNVALVLIEPRAGGGWAVQPKGQATAAQAELFDPEGANQKLRRVEDEILAHGAELVTGGLSCAAVSRKLDLPRSLVETAFQRCAAADGQLRLTRQDGDCILFRGASDHVENQHMSIPDRVRQLFSREGEETRKINELAARRAQLVQRRDRLYEDITQLERREAELLEQGRGAASQTGKLHVVSQIKTLRDDIGRLNATARVLGQQIEVISTDIHNLTLIQQGQLAKLPSSEDLAEHAVAAEEMLERLSGDVELAGTLSAGVADRLTSAEEMEILKELEAPAAAPHKATEAPAVEKSVAVPSESPPRQHEPEPGA